MILGGGFVGAKETFGKGKKGGSGTREDGTKRAGSIANVVRGIVFGEVDDVLEDELGLMGIVEEEFATKIEDLHADGGIFIGKGLGELAKDVGCNLGDLCRVFSDTPDDGGSCARHLDLVQKFCEILDDPFVLSCAHLQQLFDGHYTLCNHEIRGIGKEGHETVHARVLDFLETTGALDDGLDDALDEFLLLAVNVMGELAENAGNVGFCGDACEDLEFEVADDDGVRFVDEKLGDVGRKEFRTRDGHGGNVLEDEVLDLAVATAGTDESLSCAEGLRMRGAVKEERGDGEGDGGVARLKERDGDTKGGAMIGVHLADEIRDSVILIVVILIGFTVRVKASSLLFLLGVSVCLFLERVGIGVDKVLADVATDGVDGVNLAPFIKVGEHAADFAVVAVEEIVSFRTDLVEGAHSASKHEGRVITEQRLDALDQFRLLRRVDVVDLGDGVG